MRMQRAWTVVVAIDLLQIIMDLPFGDSYTSKFHAMLCVHNGKAYDPVSVQLS